MNAHTLSNTSSEYLTDSVVSVNERDSASSFLTISYSHRRTADQGLVLLVGAIAERQDLSDGYCAVMQKE